MGILESHEPDELEVEGRRLVEIQHTLEVVKSGFLGLGLGRHVPSLLVILVYHGSWRIFTEIREISEAQS